MKKIDYVTLAVNLKMQLESARANNHPFAEQYLIKLANRLAEKLHVDPAEFRRACGVE